jgi:hypothetical protein
MIGSKPPSSTWYWGEDMEAAKRVCDLVNAELFGLDPEAALDIVGASIEAQAAGDHQNALAGREVRAAGFALPGQD